MSQIRDWEAEKEKLNKESFFQLLGIRVIELTEGYARLNVKVDNRMNSRLGVPHGGVLSSLADSAVAMALFTMVKPDEKPVTVELNINYLRPMQGNQAIAEARIMSKGRTIAVGDVDITDKAGNLIAKSRVTFMIVA